MILKVLIENKENVISCLENEKKCKTDYKLSWYLLDNQRCLLVHVQNGAYKEYDFMICCVSLTTNNSATKNHN